MDNTHCDPQRAIIPTGTVLCTSSQFPATNVTFLHPHYWQLIYTRAKEGQSPFAKISWGMPDPSDPKIQRQMILVGNL